MASPVVIVFARAPRLGCVKRRLGAGIGSVAALRFSRNQLNATLRELSALRGWEKIIVLTPCRAKLSHPAGWCIAGQGQGGLGTRMANAFRRFPRRRVVLVGADIPSLNAQHIRAARRALNHADAVFGPARDGGFYLVAMGARRPSRPFAKARWSGPHALADTLENFRNLRVTFGETLQDVDTAEDYLRFSFSRGISSTRLQGLCRESS